MKNNFKFLTLAAFAAAAVVSCNKNKDNDNTFYGDIPLEITSDYTITAGEHYLNGECHVKSGATLTIEAGAKVIAHCDELFDYILIEQGAKINAVGTKDNPIVLTSESAADGWGGIHICGKAEINGSSATALSEIGDSVYGGTDNADNSGELKYVRVENSGKTISSEKEANGFSLYGVGSATKISYCQAYHGSDDGFEFFGGAAEISNCVVIDCTDDSFDWTQGWRGKATNIIAIQTAGSGCDCLMECDNSGSDNTRVPVSHPTITNATLISDGTGKGIRLREGTQISFDNIVVANLDTEDGAALIVESPLTHASLINDWTGENASKVTAAYDDYKVESTLENMAISTPIKLTLSLKDDDGAVIPEYTVEADEAYTETMFTDAGNKVSATFTEGAAGYILTSGDVKGAFTGADWTEGAWCIMPTL